MKRDLAMSGDYLVVISIGGVEMFRTVRKNQALADAAKRDFDGALARLDDKADAQVTVVPLVDPSVHPALIARHVFDILSKDPTRSVTGQAAAPA